MILIQYDMKQCLGVPFEIQLKEAIRHNLHGKWFLSAKFQTELFCLKICFDLYQRPCSIGREWNFRPTGPYKNGPLIPD